MVKIKPYRLFVSEDYAKEIKKEAIDAGLPLIRYTERLAQKKKRGDNNFTF